MQSKKHLVLVHGMCQGAWCWYKLKPLLECLGHKVTALDMGASGINMKPIHEIHTFDDYNEPLVSFMASLPADDKVVLVGHSLGGFNLAFAMEKFPEKISVAVFLAAFVPDTVNKPSYYPEKIFPDFTPGNEWLDCKFSTDGRLDEDEPVLVVSMGHKFMLSFLYGQSPIEVWQKFLQIEVTICYLSIWPSDEVPYPTISNCKRNICFSFACPSYEYHHTSRHILRPLSPSNQHSLNVLLSLQAYLEQQRVSIKEVRDKAPEVVQKTRLLKQMSTEIDDLYAREVEYATAVAAAVFVITTLESASRDEESQNLSGLEPSLNRIKSEEEPIVQTARSESSSDEVKTMEGPSKEDTSMPESERGNEIPEKIIHPVPPRKRLTFSLSTKDSEEMESMKPKFDTPKHSFPPPPPPPPPPPIPSTRRRPMLTLSSNEFEEFERMKSKTDTQEPSFTMPPPVPIPPPRTQPVSRPIEEAQKPRFQESEADAWERAELNKIKKRYEDLNMTILEWEDKRKKKAKNKLDKKTESDFGRKRDKALQAYQVEIEQITRVTEGAKAQAKERQRNEELKVKEKADKYRQTGEPPATCLCF